MAAASAGAMAAGTPLLRSGNAAFQAGSGDIDGVLDKGGIPVLDNEGNEMDRLVLLPNIEEVHHDETDKTGDKQHGNDAIDKFEGAISRRSDEREPRP